MDSVKADAELHIVHYNDKYQNLSEAADKPDGLAVLGILLTIQVSTGHRINRGREEQAIYSEHSNHLDNLNLRTAL